MRQKIVTASVVSLALLALACGGGPSNTSGPGGGDGKPAKKTYVLEVTGPARADITYGLGTDTSEAKGEKLPWKTQFDSVESFDLVTLTAMNPTSGKISCKITMDGNVVKTNSSTGQYAFVSCTADSF